MDSENIPSRLLTVNGGEDADDADVTNDEDAGMIVQEISKSFQDEVVQTMVDRWETN